MTLALPHQISGLVKIAKHEILTNCCIRVQGSYLCALTGVSNLSSINRNKNAHLERCIKNENKTPPLTTTAHSSMTYPCTMIARKLLSKSLQLLIVF